jgi:lysophospholipase L1-like esterase
MQPSVIAIIFLGFGTAVFTFFKPSKITNYPSAGTSIVMFGDSLIEGLGASIGRALPNLLSEMIHEKVINKGIHGQTSAQGLARINQVIDLDPKVVMVLFGGNDFLQNVPLHTTFKHIDEIVTTLQDYGAIVILLGIQGGLLEDPYKLEFKKIAQKRGALYVSNVLEGLIGDTNLMSDQVHPNDIGYRMIAERIYPVLKKVI